MPTSESGIATVGCFVGIALAAACLLPLETNARQTMQQLLPANAVDSQNARFKPKELHLALTGRPFEMRVDWALPVHPFPRVPCQTVHMACDGARWQLAHEYTVYHHRNAIPVQLCQYGWAAGNLTRTALAQSHTYTDGGFSGMLYSAVLAGLTAARPSGEPVRRVFYRCGSKASFSHEYSFVQPPVAASNREVKARAADRRPPTL